VEQQRHLREAEAEQREQRQRRGEQQRHEWPVVATGDAAAQDGAVVVERRHTHTAQATVMAACEHERPIAYPIMSQPHDTAPWHQPAPRHDRRRRRKVARAKLC
jgi:hypothetical protein